ncbi:MAG: sulfite exporter TauE/SafE family protein [Nanoarchaeota archaeon]|jgi:cytochrome c biogenesis protein CcdA|nr:sulfite exporter TauE/SafE family protein [Nanoarchaeota archaeon]
MSELLRITGLALADSVNPCAIAVLTMVLVSILVNNPKDKKKVLFSGLAFVAAVFVSYLFYGTIIVQLFKSMDAFLRVSSVYVNKGLALLAIGIGILNVKDYFSYKKGSFATEMPLFMRPRVKKFIQEITSPKGAFTVGFIVTLFLLPCTMGPYIAAAGTLATLSFIKIIPWLIYYNILFVLPMLAITFLVYWGFKEVDEVAGWKERNIKKLHLIAGILLIVVGILIFKGLL